MISDPLLRFRPEFPILGVSPHFYTTDEELDRAFEAIDDVRASGAWERWRDRPAVVT